MKERTILVYSYDELSEEAKENAKQHYMENMFDNHWWHEHTIEHIADIGAIIGITIDKGKHGYHAYFDLDRGNYFAFDGSYSYKKGWREAVRKEWGTDSFTKPLSKQDITLTFLRNFSYLEWEAQYVHWWSVNCTCTSGNHGRMSINADCDCDHYHGAPEKECDEIIGAFCSWAWDILEAEYEYLQSDEYVENDLRGYEFDKAGGIL